MPKSFSKESATPVLVSRVLMPTNWTPLPAYSLEILEKYLASARHGPHQEPHTFRTTTSPL
jgi:hypothetical protein